MCTLGNSYLGTRFSCPYFPLIQLSQLFIFNVHLFTLCLILKGSVIVHKDTCRLSDCVCHCRSSVEHVRGGGTASQTRVCGRLGEVWRAGGVRLEAGTPGGAKGNNEVEGGPANSPGLGRHVSRLSAFCCTDPEPFMAPACAILISFLCIGFTLFPLPRMPLVPTSSPC